MKLLKKTILNLYYLLPWNLWGIGYKLLFKHNIHKNRFRKLCVGKKSYIDPSVRILGWRNVQIGNNTILSEDVWLNINHRDEGINRIRIGNNCHIGMRNFFSSGPLITLKDYCFTGIDCHFLGCGHNIESPFKPYIASGLSKGDFIEIGVNCWLTTSVTVMQGVKIGHGSIIGSRSVVLNNIPPFSVAVGNPCKVIKRYDFNNNTWIDIQNWTEELDACLPAEDDYLKLLNEKYSDNTLALISSSRKFGWI
jgi:acetyltransferase-like isoleucine patch superfamily enzyme